MHTMSDLLFSIWISNLENYGFGRGNPDTKGGSGPNEPCGAYTQAQATTIGAGGGSLAAVDAALAIGSGTIAAASGVNAAVVAGAGTGICVVGIECVMWAVAYTFQNQSAPCPAYWRLPEPA